MPATHTCCGLQGIADPWLWAPRVAHSWRTTFDIHPRWPAVMQNLDESIGLARFAGPGKGWGDMDMLEVSCCQLAQGGMHACHRT
jgi:hypothetical protein